MYDKMSLRLAAAQVTSVFAFFSYTYGNQRLSSLSVTTYSPVVRL